ncbi:MAG TPA: hypothetical protein ENH34_01850 [Phycisphaerales bacterium]|nr:hypothetical protein [Phycisphaerales bacterium]
MKRILFYFLTLNSRRTLKRTPMTTAAAIDRLVHHSVVLELNVPSYRAEQARKRKDKDKISSIQNPAPPMGGTP